MTQASGVNVGEIRSLLFPNAAPSRVLQSARALMGALPLIAQALVDTVGHKVRVVRTHEKTAMTDGTTIAITDVAMPRDNADVDTFLYYVAMKMGLFFHELGHVNETDFTVGFPRDRLTSYLLNLIEDVRQEVEFCKSVKTGRQHLRALAYAMVDLGIDTPVTDQDQPDAAFTGYLYYRLRAEYAGEAVYVPLMQGAEQQLRRHFNEAFIIKMNALIGEVPGLTSTHDALVLAEAFRSLVVDEIKALQKQQKQQQKQQQGQSSSSAAGNAPPSGSPDPSQDGSANGQPPSSGDAKGASSNPSASDPNAASSSSPSGSDANGSAGQGAGSGNDPADAGSTQGSGPQMSAEQLAEAISALQATRDAKALQGNGSRDQRLSNELNTTQQTLQASGDYDLVNPQTEAVTQANNEQALTTQVQSGYSVDLMVAQSVVGPLRARLANRLHADSHTKTGHSKRGTRIDPRRLVSAAVGNPRIFQTHQEGVTVDTAVFLLADCSGSMDGQKMIVTDQALFATAAAMETFPGVSIAVGAFPGNQLVLPFGQRVRHAEARFKLRSWGGTPMAEGIRMASRLLQRRQEPRKLLFVLTDGEPDNKPNARAAILGAQYIGIETFGIGIQCRSVERLFEQSVVLETVTELPEKMFALIDTKLGRKAA
jgi:uncharacterized protein YegL